MQNITTLRSNFNLDTLKFNAKCYIWKRKIIITRVLYSFFCLKTMMFDYPQKSLSAQARALISAENRCSTVV